MDKLFGRSSFFIITFFAILLVSLPTQTITAHAASLSPSTQTPDLFYNELQIVYLTNLRRREAGLPPLRWNREMSQAARWFAQNSVDGRNGPYCGHVDTDNRSLDKRLDAFNYTNAKSWGENVVCGLAAAEAAVNGWMNSAGHKQNILQSDYREIGVGYYRNPTNGRGYIVQDFSYDPAYAPVIINNEAPQTTVAEVQLYIYNRVVQSGLEGMGDATAMMIANDPSFAGAEWEPFTHERNWTLVEGEGWRTVYVKTRDAQGRTSLVSDMIYLGATLPRESLSLEQASTVKRELDFYNLDKSGWPAVQLSVNWQGDDSDALFELITGNGEEVSEADAVGGTVLKIGTGRAGYARYWTTEFHKNVELIAYVRLKVSDNQSPEEVLSFKVEGGGVTYGPLQIKGTDFTHPNTYQEFSLPFTFHENNDQRYLTFHLYSSGKSTVFVDTITVYTTALPSQNRLSWPVLGGYHRSRGIWGRFINSDGKFSKATELIPNAEDVLPDAPTPETSGDNDAGQSAYQVLLPVAIK